MKKLLVPTDFSENAKRAVFYAAGIANKFGAVLHLMHVVKASASAGHLSDVESIIHQEREKDMAALVKEVKGSLSEGVLLETSIVHGYAIEVICEEADRIGADLILMGTQGSSGIKTFFLGSSTSNVIKGTTLPVLAIPDEFSQLTFTNATVSLDAHKLPEPFVLQPLLELVRKFGMKLNVLHIVQGKDATNGDIDPAIKDFFLQFNVAYEYHRVQAINIGEGILEFVKKQNSDLLCVLSQEEKRGWFENLFHNSVTNEMAHRSEVPLLVLHI